MPIQQFNLTYMEILAYYSYFYIPASIFEVEYRNVQKYGLYRLEEIQPHPKEVALSDIMQAFRETADIVGGVKTVCIAPLQQAPEMIAIDFDLVLQVFENLISNAARYAENRVDIAVLLIKK